MTGEQIYSNEYSLTVVYIILAPLSMNFNLSKLLINKVHDCCRPVGSSANCVRSKANKTGVRALRVLLFISVRE